MLSLSEARRVAIAAQGLDRPRPPRKIGRADLRRTLRRLGLIQIDSVNVLIPAHYLPLFSRLGPYDTQLFDDLVYRRREWIEQWAHEASLVPVETWPLLAHRRATHRVRPYGFEAMLEQHPEYVDWIVEEIRKRGPLSAADLPEPPGTTRKIGHAWFGTIPRAVLEAHFGRGTLAVSSRLRNFARTFDLAERVLPSEHHGRVIDRADAERELLRLAAQAHGIGTAADLGDYYRMKPAAARPRLAELVESGDLQSVQVEGWRDLAFLHKDARTPRKVEAAALLSPFDPLIWFRPRVERLFHFDYRIEIYVPQAKRKWGYYVLPFLLNDRLVARLDLKADRRSGRLLVLSAHAEPDTVIEEIVPALASELRNMASWLKLADIVVAKRAPLARALAKKLSQS